MSLPGVASAVPRGLTRLGSYAEFAGQLRDTATPPSSAALPGARRDQRSTRELQATQADLGGLRRSPFDPRVPGLIPGRPTLLTWQFTESSRKPSSTAAPRQPRRQPRLWRTTAQRSVALADRGTVAPSTSVVSCQRPRARPCGRSA